MRISNLNIFFQFNKVFWYLNGSLLTLLDFLKTHDPKNQK